MFQPCDSIDGVDSLRAMCCTYEAPCNDACEGKFWCEAAAGAIANSASGVTPDVTPDIAVTGRDMHTKPASPHPWELWGQTHL